MFESVYSHCLDQHVKILEYSVYVEQRSLRKRNKLFRSMLKGRSEFVVQSLNSKGSLFPESNRERIS